MAYHFLEDFSRSINIYFSVSYHSQTRVCVTFVVVSTSSDLHSNHQLDLSTKSSSHNHMLDRIDDDLSDDDKEDDGKSADDISKLVMKSTVCKCKVCHIVCKDYLTSSRRYSVLESFN